MLRPVSIRIELPVALEAIQPLLGNYRAFPYFKRDKAMISIREVRMADAAAIAGIIAEAVKRGIVYLPSRKLLE